MVKTNDQNEAQAETPDIPTVDITNDYIWGELFTIEQDPSVQRSAGKKSGNELPTKQLFNTHTSTKQVPRSQSSTKQLSNTDPPTNQASNTQSSAQRPSTQHSSLFQTSLTDEQILQQDPDLLRDRELLQLAMTRTLEEIQEEQQGLHGRAMAKSTITDRFRKAFMSVAEVQGVFVGVVKSEFYNNCEVESQHGMKYWRDHGGV